jgi:hypothetical protein
MGLILGMLTRIPFLAYVVIAVAAWGGWQRWQAVRADKQLATANIQIDAANASVKAASESLRLSQAQQGVIDEQTKRIAEVQADAAAAAAAAGRLRSRLDSIARRGPTADPGPVGQAADPPTSVLADVLIQCSERRAELALYADSAREAGLACQQSYDTLTAP